MFRRKTKQLMAALLAVTMTVGLSGEIYAAGSEQSASQTTQTTAPTKTTPTYNKATSQKVMTALDVIPQNKMTTAGLKKKVSRQEFAKMLVKLSDYKDQVSSVTKTSMYSDVKKKSSYTPYIKIAVQNGWMKGNLKGKFRPNAAITLQEAVIGVVAVLGYEDSDFSGNRSAAKMAFYKNNKLNKNISRSKTAALTYADVTYLLYNMLVTPTKSGSIYAQSLGYTLDSNGDVDYLSIIYDELEGPIIATGDWKKELPFSLEAATVYEDGAKSNASIIKEYDVIYYSKTQKQVFVYNDRVTGRLNSVSPDRYTPNAVTVADVKYTLASQEIAYEFSVLGSYEIGDYITLLMGKDNTVVGIGSAATLKSFVGGIVIDTEEKMDIEDKNSAEVKKYIKMLDTTGETHEYEVTDLKEFKKKDPVEVTFPNGKPVVNKVTLYRIYGDVDKNASRFADFKLSDNTRILEYDLHDSDAKIKRTRLAGLTIKASDVLYYHVNSEYELTDLMLSGVTGDSYSYGILLSARETVNSMTMRFEGVYNYLIDDATCVALSEGTVFDLVGYTGPAQFSFNADGTATSIRKLDKMLVSSITSKEVSDGRSTYLLDENVCVYVESNKNYYFTELSKVMNLDKFEVSAYFDGQSSGRIRVIVAKSKE